jgi:hypothetical protein
MATLDQTGRVVDDELSEVRPTARKIDPATMAPMPMLEEFGIVGQRVAGINWKAVLIAGLIGVLVIEIVGNKRR